MYVWTRTYIRSVSNFKHFLPRRFYGRGRQFRKKIAKTVDIYSIRIEYGLPFYGHRTGIHSQLGCLLIYH